MYFPDKRQFSAPLGNSPGLSGMRSFANMKVASSGGRVRPTRLEDAKSYSDRMIAKHGDPLADAAKFIGGGRKLGESAVSATAANKIVGFKGGNVRPAKTNLSSVVNTISSNITNEVNNISNNISNFTRSPDTKIVRPKESVVNNIQQIKQVQGPQVTQVQKIIQNIQNKAGGLIDKIKQEYSNTVENPDSNKQSSLLDKFLSTFKNAFGLIQLIQYFGDKKNIKKFRKSLNQLQKLFVESFEIAKILRRVILKIFGQLRGLPRGGLLGGGLGGLLGGLGAGAAGAAGAGALKGGVKAKPRRGGKGKLGLGLLLGGLLGAGTMGAVNAMTDQPEVETVKTDTQIPAEFMDKFGMIVDKFYDIIERLFKKPNEKKKTGGGSSSSGRKPTGPGSTPPPGAAVDYSNLESGDISSMEGKAATIYDELRKQGVTEEGAKRMVAEIGREGSFANENLFGTHTDPAAGISNTGMISWNAGRRDNLIAAAKQAGVWDESKGRFKETAEALRFQVRFMKSEMTGANASQGYRDTWSALTDPNSSGAKVSAALRDKYIVYRADAQYSGGRDEEYGSGRSKEWYQKVTPGIEGAYKPKQTPTPTPSTPNPLFDWNNAIKPDMQSSNLKTSTSQQIAAVPVSQGGNQSPTIIPFPMGSGGQSQPPLQVPMQSPQTQTAQFVPKLSTEDSDNFSTLYAKMVYNIVDA